MDENKVDLLDVTEDVSNGEDEKQDGLLESKEQQYYGASIREKWKDPVYRQKVIYSLFMSASFSALGMYLGQHGPTFLDVQIITKTDLEEASAFFTGGNAGHLAGCILTGILFSKIDSSLLMFVVTLGLGVTNMVLPYCTHFELMVFIRFVSAAFGGGIANGLNTGHLALWGSEANGLLQFSHFVFSVGGMLSPLFSEPFLVDSDDVIVEKTTNITYDSNDKLDSDSHNLLNTNYNNNSTSTPLPAEESSVKYVFFITGIYAVLTAVPFIVIFTRRGKKKAESSDGLVTISQRKIPFSFIVVMLFCVCFFDLLYLCVETTQFNYVMAFLVAEFNVSKSKGAFITALGWGSFAAARFLMIFLTKVFTPLQLLIILTTLLAVSQCAFTIFAHLGIVSALIVFSAVSAFAMSGIFPASLSWAEMELFHVTGIFTSCVVVSSSLGNMLNPLFLGYFMENFSNMWFCYLLLIESVLMCFTLIVLLLFSRCYVNKNFGSFEISSEICITSEVKSLESDRDLNAGVKV